MVVAVPVAVPVAMPAAALRVADGSMANLQPQLLHAQPQSSGKIVGGVASIYLHSMSLHTILFYIFAFNSRGLVPVLHGL